MNEAQKIESAERVIENYFGCEMPDVLIVDCEQAMREVHEWMVREDMTPLPEKWEFQIAYERVVAAQKEFQS